MGPDTEETKRGIVHQRTPEFLLTTTQPVMKMSFFVRRELTQNGQMKMMPAIKKYDGTNSKDHVQYYKAVNILLSTNDNVSHRALNGKLRAYFTWKRPFGFLTQIKIQVENCGGLVEQYMWH